MLSHLNCYINKHYINDLHGLQENIQIGSNFKWNWDV